jgi:hypothetical protein
MSPRVTRFSRVSEKNEAWTNHLYAELGARRTISSHNKFLPQRKHNASPLQRSVRLMLFREITSGYSENHMKQIHSADKIQLLNVKVCNSLRIKRCALKNWNVLINWLFRLASVSRCIEMFSVVDIPR